MLPLRSLSEYTSQKIAEGIFLLFMAGIMALAYSEIAEYNWETGVVPTITTVLMFLAFVCIIGIKSFSHLFGEEPIDQDSGNEIDDLTDSTESNDLSDVKVKGVAKTFIWIFGYIFGIFYIGFFTSTFLFCFIVSLVKIKSPNRPMVVAQSLIASSLVLLTIYIIFGYLMKVHSIWRFGFLP